MAVPVKVLLIEPIWKSVSSVTGSGWSTFVTPNARVVTRPSSRMPMATPGTACSVICACTRAAIFSNRASAGACRAAPVTRSPTTSVMVAATR